MTPEEKDHIETTKLYVGCMPCILERRLNAHADYHHVVEGERLGHLIGFGMCLWHHRGEIQLPGMTADMMGKQFGPSFAREKKRFIERYGDQLSLVEANNLAVSMWAVMQWPAHEMPYEIARTIRRQCAKFNKA